jgi:hypothetical protein
LLVVAVAGDVEFHAGDQRRDGRALEPQSARSELGDVIHYREERIDVR